MVDHTEYRLAFILPQSMQLLAIQSAGVSELPLVRIPLWRRPAEQLTQLIREQWAIKTLVLDVLWDATLPNPCALIEVRSPEWQFTRQGFAAVPVDNVSSLYLGDTQRAALHSVLAGGDAGRGPFTRIGWIEEAQTWIETSIKDHKVCFTDDIHHLNAGGEFCLLRLGNSAGPSYWLKAVGGSNAHEFSVTSYLGQHCPEFLPPIVTTRVDWNAWVMEEFGSSLHSSNSLIDFKSAACKLANLQKQLVGKSGELLKAQCADQRLGELCSHVDEIIEYLIEAMGQQTSIKVLPLSSLRLRQIGLLLHDTCSAMENLNIPDSIVHNDISPGSILNNGTECVFTDWCEAYVGNPFITLGQLCVHVVRKTDEPEFWVRALKNVYKSCWIDFLTEHQIDRALQLTPLISVLSYLYGRGDWLRSSRRNEPAFLSYSRSLARHMNRITSSPDFTEGLWLHR